MDGTFTTRLLAWYDANKRDLPWRREISPYGVWISEIMAQQTQICRVVEYWERWMELFPNIETLASAHEEEVLKVWEGLGYYSRARNILKSAGVIQAQHGGQFPTDFSEIRSLPGIGPYTAGAISSIAFSEAEAAVDANVLRVFSRLFDIKTPVKDKQARDQVEAAVAELMPKSRPGDFNQAIMEFGALVCSKNPSCPECPVREDCRAYDQDVVHDRPVLPKAKNLIYIDMATGVLLHDGMMLIQKRRPDDVWPGLWEFPGGCVEEGETPEQALVREYMEEVELDVVPGERLTTIKYSYTRYRVTMHCFLCYPRNGESPEPVFNEATTGHFVFPDELSAYAFPSGHRRLIEFMQSHSFPF